MSSLPAAVLPNIGIRTSFQIVHGLLSLGERVSAAKPPATVVPIAPPGFALFEHVGAARVTAEQFISRRFHESYASRVELFMPRLFTLRQQNGDICGAFGLRSANRKLFLEQYLDTPIDQVIAARTGRATERRSIVEVGHFSGAFPGSARAMIELLTEQLHREGVEWVAFTGTTALRNTFSRLGLAPIDIQAATVDRLPEDERAAWGSYYDNSPRVLVGNVGEGFRAMHGGASSSQALAGAQS